MITSCFDQVLFFSINVDHDSFWTASWISFHKSVQAVLIFFKSSQCYVFCEKDVYVGW